MTLNAQPLEPKSGAVWYRGWECGYDDDSARYGLEPWSAYKGGAALDAPHITAKSWRSLLDEIDDKEDE